MSHSIHILASSVFVALGAASPLLAQDEATIAQFLQIRTPSQVRLAPDGSVYYRDWPDGVNQLFRRGADEPITAQGKALTSFKDGITRRQGFQISPDGRWVVVPVDTGGNEDHDLYLLDTRTDELKPILVDPDVKHTAQMWLKDSSGFLFTANMESPDDFFIYKYDIEYDISELWWEAAGYWFVGDVSDDGTKFLAVNYHSVSNSRVLHVDHVGGDVTDISATQRGEISFNMPVGYMRGGATALVVSDIGDDGIRQLYRVPLDSRSPDFGEYQPVLPDLANVEFGDAAMNDERSLIAVTHNEGGYGTLRIYSLPAFELLPTPKIDRGVVGVSEIQGNTLVYTLSNARTPGLSFAYDISRRTNTRVRGVNKPHAISARMDSEPVDLSEFRLPELVSIESFDGLEVPAFLYLPEGFKRGTPIPFVIQFHGGPEGQARPSFNATLQYLVSNGYGVMVPNVRGSTGYGRAYHQMDNYKKRWDSVRDGAEAARWLVHNGYSEAGRIAAYGGSYGGFMAVATVIEGADVFGASVDIVGLVNFQTFLQRTRGYRRKLREAEYGPLKDPAFLASISPLNRASEIRARMFIAHGLNDPRVPVEEAMQLAEALQKLGRDPEMMFFYDEGHGFAKLDNRILFGEATVKFLDETIGPDAVAH